MRCASAGANIPGPARTRNARPGPGPSVYYTTLDIINSETYRKHTEVNLITLFFYSILLYYTPSIL